MPKIGHLPGVVRTPLGGLVGPNSPSRPRRAVAYLQLAVLVASPRASGCARCTGHAHLPKPCCLAGAWWHTSLSSVANFGQVADGRTTSVYQDAVRLLLLIAAAAEPLPVRRSPDAPPDAVAILRSQVLLQKLDFWLRNPDYLADELISRFERDRNSEDLALARDILESDEPEIRSYQMLRHLFGAYEPLDEALSVLRTPERHFLTATTTEDSAIGGQSSRFAICRLLSERLGEVSEVVVPGPELPIADDVQTALRAACGDVHQVWRLGPAGWCPGLVGVAAQDEDDDGCFASLCCVDCSGPEASILGDEAAQPVGDRPEW